LGPVQEAVRVVLGLKGPRGRRWRPLLTLATAEALGRNMADAVDAAVAVELTHAASLVLDDMPCMDDSTERRGVPATHRLVGNAGAILVAVGLLARAAEFLGRSRDGAALAEEWGDVFGFRGMSGGQAVDMATGGTCTGPVRRLYRRKTTALSAFAVTAGARASGVDAHLLTPLRRFGRDLGWAYQLVDDAHDRAEDRANGRPRAGRDPLKHGTRILNRALRELASDASLGPDRSPLLAHLAREVVGVPPPGSIPSEEVA
jgi:geranylgeranyl diphosphate synthase type II